MNPEKSSIYTTYYENTIAKVVNIINDEKLNKNTVKFWQCNTLLANDRLLRYSYFLDKLSPFYEIF